MVAAERHANDLVLVGAVKFGGDWLVIDDVTALEAAARHDDAPPADPLGAFVLLPVGFINPDRLGSVTVRAVALLVRMPQGDIDHVLRFADMDGAALEAFLRARTELVEV